MLVCDLKICILHIFFVCLNENISSKTRGIQQNSILHTNKLEGWGAQIYIKTDNKIIYQCQWAKSWANEFAPLRT